MQPPLVIRRLGPQDADILRNADVFDGPVAPHWLAGFLAEPSHLIVVALRQGRVVGFASGAVLHHPDKAPALYIMELGVNEETRRQGIASALVAGLLDAGQAHGATAAWVLTEADNTRARTLYRRLGARETPDVVMFDWDAADAPATGNA